MVDINSENGRCNHCGGALTFSVGGECSCLMCGRPVGHKCDSCMSLPAKTRKGSRSKDNGAQAAKSKFPALQKMMSRG